MSDSNQGPWKVITGLAVVAAVLFGVLWFQAKQGTVDATVADSLRQETQQLSSTVQELEAMPPETVYAEPPERQRTESRMSEKIRSELSQLEAVLPGAETHPAYHDRLRSIRSALDTLSGS